MGRRVLAHRAVLPVFGDLKVQLRVRWGDTMRAYCLVVDVAGLMLVRVSCDQRRVFALFIFQADFPIGQEFGPRLDFSQLRILKGTLELAGDDIFETVVGNDVMRRSLVLDRDGLLH